MRVLAVCCPAPGHVNPLRPLLSALVTQGDEVVGASGEAVRDRIESTGARFCAAGTGFETWWPRLAARTRGAPGDGLSPANIERYWVPRLFGEVAADDMIDGLVACGRALRPDLVLFETESFAAPLAAAVLGAPAVHHQVGLLMDPLVLDLTADAVSPLWRAFDREVPRYAGIYSGLTLRTSPAALDREGIPGGDVVLPLRPVPSPLPAAAADPPLVHVTLGTVMNSDFDVFRAALDGLAEEPVRVLVTVGENNDPAALGPLPPNAVVERYVDHAALLPRCSLVVHHGGAGTMLMATVHGLPQVVVPQGGDQFRNAAALEAAGVARTLLPGQVDAASVRSAVRAVVDGAAYADSARRIGAEIAAMPPADAVARELRTRFG